LAGRKPGFERFEGFFFREKFLSAIRDFFLHFQLGVSDIPMERERDLDFLETAFFASELLFLETDRLSC
jgi:hypothetical protein